ncbi:MAG: DUF4102 domain-containing protein, partial [Xanthomonadales bacterium]|nr:DUF4102 domain-containing protein [Xanthomonadales bacterium]
MYQHDVPTNRLKMKLNNTKIKALKPDKKQYKVSDGRGLFLLVHPNGSKYWRLSYRYDDKQKTIALGTYPDISLAQARDKTHEIKSKIANGIDPSEQRKNKKRKIKKYTFLKVAKQWYD